MLRCTPLPTPKSLFPLVTKIRKPEGGVPTIAVAVAPDPLPTIVTVGAVEYPAPLLSATVTPVTAPPAVRVISVGGVPPKSGPVTIAVADV